MAFSIFWLFGNTGAGKTTLGKIMAAKLDAFHLDGDDMQRELSMFDMSPQGRRDRCLITANRAKNLAGLRPVVVSMITPYEDLREEIKAITGAFFIYLPYGASASTKNPFEAPVLEHLVYQRGPGCLPK